MAHSWYTDKGQRAKGEGLVKAIPFHLSLHFLSCWNHTMLGLLLITALLIALAGCGPTWQATAETPAGDSFIVDRQVLDSLEAFASEQGVPLERVLLQAGHRAVERIGVTEAEDARHEFDWAAVAGDAWWQQNGKLSIGGDTFSAPYLDVEPPALLAQVQARIIDIAPTAAKALGLPAPAQASGQVLEVPSASHVLLLFLDGFGYVRYSEALEDGLIPNLATLGEPHAGLTVYPPCTSVATAALLSGAPPEVTGVDQRGIRKTEAETLLDVAAAQGLHVVAVEGDALAFNLRNAEIQLSGDRDGNGSTDDNVLANALAVLDEGMPDLFYVHFHGIDDAGHSYGPGAPEEEAAIRGVDAAVGRIIEKVPPETLIIIFADHGMHAVEEEGRLGNHEHLSERDIFIPIWVVEK
jgi:hypothetical protein